jgi:cellulose synthase/poly-beta-1,6-N-acetylglucosamine synthase-like glycosyltransferase
VIVAAICFLLLGSLLGAGMLGIGSVLANFFFGTKHEPDRAPGTEPFLVELLIPAHNEELKIGATLESIAKAIQALPSPSGLEVKIQLGLDRCNDGTGANAQAFKSQLEIEEVRFDFGSKWRTMRELFDRRNPLAHWIAFVDAGTVWEPDLLKAALPCLHDPTFSVLAPSYDIKGGSAPARFFWRLERLLKTMENRLGGPISVHGATMFFRAPPLASAYKRLDLEAGDFRNDDIILPLATRLANPSLDSLYLPQAKMHDQADLEAGGSAWRRRKRMTLGNLQWIRWLARQKDVPYAIWIVAMRRIFRLFWAYVFVFFTAGILFAGQPAGLLLLLPLMLAPAAAVASLATPIAGLLGIDRRPSAWR